MQQKTKVTKHTPMAAASPPKLSLQFKDKYDKEFINLVLEIEKRYTKLIKQDRLKVESWIKKLCIPTINEEWKKNRNLHAIMMLDMILNNKLEEPYNKFASEIQSLPLLSKTLLKSKLSRKFNDEITLSECEHNLDEFSNTFLNQYFILPSSDGKRLKEKKMELKEKLGNYSHRTKSHIRSKSQDIHKYNENSPCNILNKNYSSNPYLDKKLIDNYYFQRDIEKLKKLLSTLEQENKFKDEIIMKQNEQKKKLNTRVTELESAVEKIIKNKDNEQILKSVIKILNKK